ncbi:MAG: competence/damage-inducible protein A [Schwartzia sp.]|nr:competence/damage-inducible protein A [Schwartzia sp. (in: firmicutes)]
MIAELVTTGSELLLGQIVNTNAAYLARELNKMGFDVCFQTTVGDNRERMKEVLAHALSRADIVITSGGLGPTRGDITKEVSAEVMGLGMALNEECATRLKAFFARVGREMTENNLRQAMIPDGAHVFVNHAGTAPGVAMEKNGKLLVNLPGPPTEMKDMFRRSLAPFLTEKFGVPAVILSRVLHTFGIGESMLETKLDDLVLAQKNPTLAFLVRPTGVIVRITAKAENGEAARRLIEPMEKEIRARLGDLVYGADDETMEEVVGRELASHGFTAATAESCTGGLVASRLTDVAGSSEYVKGGVVSYTDEVKAEVLGVSRELLTKEGAVSEAVARAMAEGVRKKIGADFGVSTTGLAGPGGGTAETPVGTVFIAVAGPKGTDAEKYFFTGKRGQVKFRASQAALAMLRGYIKQREQ